MSWKFLKLNVKRVMVFKHEERITVKALKVTLKMYGINYEFIQSHICQIYAEEWSFSWIVLIKDATFKFYSWYSGAERYGGTLIERLTDTVLLPVNRTVNPPSSCKEWSMTSFNWNWHFTNSSTRVLEQTTSWYALISLHNVL